MSIHLILVGNDKLLRIVLETGLVNEINAASEVMSESAYEDVNIIFGVLIDRVGVRVDGEEPVLSVVLTGQWGISQSNFVQGEEGVDASSASSECVGGGDKVQGSRLEGIQGRARAGEKVVQKEKGL